MSFTNFVYIVHLTKFTRESSLLLEKSLLMEKLKAKESLLKKEKERVPLCESEPHAGVQISNKDIAVISKLVIH